MTKFIFGRKSNAFSKKKRSCYIKAYDTAFSQYIKTRDCLMTSGSTRYGFCITCGGSCSRVYDESIDPKRCGTNGHYIARANMFLRYDLRNNNLQCRYCNDFLQNAGWVKEAYREALDKKWGAGTAQLLEDSRFIMTKLSRTEMEEKTEYYKEEIAILFKQFGEM